MEKATTSCHTFLVTMNQNQFVDLSHIVDSDEEQESQPSPHVAWSQPSPHVVWLGNPIAKPSPRFRGRFMGFGPGGQPNVHAWAHNPVADDLWSHKMQAMTQLQHQSISHFPLYPSEPVSIKVWFCRKPPLTCFVNKDRTRPKGDLLKAQLGLTKPVAITIKPDDDNMLKFVLDAMKSVAWTDDSQVAKILAYKCYDSTPPFEGRTLIELSVAEVENFPRWSY